MTPVRVLYVISKMGVGGTERHLLEVLGHLDRRRVAPALHCLRLRPEDRYAAEARRLGVEVVDGGVGETLQGPALAPAVARLAAELRRRRVEVVHAYLFHANFVGPLAARLARVPVALASKRNLDRYPRRRDRVICRVGNALADRVTVNAEAVREHIHRLERCPREKLVVVPNGIDVRRVQAWPREAWWRLLGGPPRGPVIGTVGRLVPTKGQADLLEAAVSIVDRVPDARLVLAGDGPLRTALEDRARALGLAGHVAFLGEVPDAAGLLPWLDLFVLPSLIEGMPNSAIEAMAARRAAVVTDVGGNAEVVVDGGTGLVVPARDPRSLAEAVLTLLKDPERARAMGEAGRARAAALFGADRMARRLEALYGERLDAAGGRRG